MSQFSRKPKKTTNNNDKDSEPENHIDVRIGRQLDELEAEFHGTGFGDEELDVGSDGNEDEIAGDVATSDALAIDEAILEAELSVRLDLLPSNQANVGHISIAKVSFRSRLFDFILH